MRTLPLVVLAALLAACSNTPDATPRHYEENAEATRHLEAGRRLFASAETAPVPSEALALALPELKKAKELVPSPEHRFAHARVALLLDAENEEARKELAACAEEVPGDARFHALLALAEASDALRSASASDLEKAAERAEKALTIAAVTTAREVRCFVGDQTCFAAALVQKRDVVRAANIIVKAAELGSPWALMNEALIHWLARGPALDRKKALSSVQKAAETTFTPEEIGRGLLFGLAVATRRAARDLGHMHVEEGEWKDAQPWLERGLSLKEDLAYPTGDPDPQAVLALAELGAIEALSLGDAPATARERGRLRLELASKLGFTPALTVLARIDKDHRDELLQEAKKRGSPGGFAGTGDFEGLLRLAEQQRDSSHDALEKLLAQRLEFFARAVEKGGAVRVDTEKAAREAVEGAPENMPLARQFRHIAGDLSADDLQRTMPRSAHIPRWRVETELALATRCLLVADKDGAKKHLGILLDTCCLFSTEDELAWGALRLLSGK